MKFTVTLQLELDTDWDAFSAEEHREHLEERIAEFHSHYLWQEAVTDSFLGVTLLGFSVSRELAPDETIDIYRTPELPPGDYREAWSKGKPLPEEDA